MDGGKDKITMVASLLAMIFFSTMLVLVMAMALFGDPALSAFKGVPWAVDTPEHRFWLMCALCVGTPLSGMALGMSLMSRSAPVELFNPGRAR